MPAMGVLDDCPELITGVGNGRAVFTTGEPAGPPERWMADLAARTPMQGEMLVFAPTTELESEALRGYLTGAANRGIDVVLAVVDPATRALVTDLEALK